MAKHAAINWYNSLAAKFEGYPPYVADIVIFGPLGFGLGFLLKSLGRYLLIGLLVSVGILWLAESFGVISIHQEQLHAFIGVPTFSSLSEFNVFLKTWAQEHVPAVVAFFFGFLFGWKLGL